MMPLWTTEMPPDMCGCELRSEGTPCVAQRVCAMPMAPESFSLPASFSSSATRPVQRTRRSADFAAFADKEMKAGKTVDQAAGEFKLDPKYKGYVASANPQFGGVKPNLQIAYDEMKKK